MADRIWVTTDCAETAEPTSAPWSTVWRLEAYSQFSRSSRCKVSYRYRATQPNQRSRRQHSKGHSERRCAYSRWQVAGGGRTSASMASRSMRSEWHSSSIELMVSSNCRTSSLLRPSINASRFSSRRFSATACVRESQRTGRAAGGRRCPTCFATVLTLRSLDQGREALVTLRLLVHECLLLGVRLSKPAVLVLKLL